MIRKLYSWVFMPETWKYVHTKSYAPMHTAALFIIAKLKKKFRCLSVGEYAGV